VRVVDIFVALHCHCAMQTGVKKKSVAGVRGKKSAVADTEKEEPMEKELSVS